MHCGAGVWCRLFIDDEVECIRRRIFATREEAKRSIFAWGQRCYNRTRRHSTLDYLSPFEYERQYKLSIKNVH
ncbi:MAG: IS3 family transposase [Candidatus Omnitrophica bacterium]|nr:IS3 family transposase [Candidatus Omnitrophota bacterium]